MSIPEQNSKFWATGNDSEAGSSSQTEEEAREEKRKARMSPKDRKREEEARAKRQAQKQKQEDDKPKTWFETRRTRQAKAAKKPKSSREEGKQPKEKTSPEEEHPRPKWEDRQHNGAETRKQAKQREKLEAAAARKRQREREREEQSERDRAKHTEAKSHRSFEPSGPQDPAAYDKWMQACTLFFADPDTPFPSPPHSSCRGTNCIRGDTLKACHHDVEKTLGGSPAYSEVFLKKERLRWHPDKLFGRPEAQGKAQEVFVMIQRIIDGE